MNASFKHILEVSKMKAPTLTHQQAVTRLYRHSLKTAFSWAVSRDIFHDEVDRIRKRFDDNKDVSISQGEALLAEGKEELKSFYHPDRYVIPWMPGGSKFMRNPPPPMEILYGSAEAVPEEMKTGIHTPVYPDMVPINWRDEQPTSYVIDFSKKTME